MATRFLPPREVSIYDSLKASIVYEMYAERPDETSWGADPFDILAEREEEAGMPLIDMPDNDD